MNAFAAIHNNANDNIRGEFGEAVADLFFVQNGYRVCPASGDWYPYDLLVERHNQINRIQVKTVTNRNGRASYKVSFSSTEFDFAFILTGEGDLFLIPRHVLHFPAKSNKGWNVQINTEKLSAYNVGTYRGIQMTAGIDGIMGIA